MNPRLLELAVLVQGPSSRNVEMTWEHPDWERALELIQELRVSALDDKEQEFAFDVCMKSFAVFCSFLDGQVGDLPRLLRYCLISKSLYGWGSTLCPNDIEDLVEDLVGEGSSGDWYQNPETSGRIHSVRLGILRDPSIDPAILEDEAESSGELDTIRAIIENPSCPKDLLETIATGNVLAFLEMDQDDDLLAMELRDIRAKATARLKG